jgi:hypothetical protein
MLDAYQCLHTICEYLPVVPLAFPNAARPCALAAQDLYRIGRSGTCDMFVIDRAGVSVCALSDPPQHRRVDDIMAIDSSGAGSTIRHRRCSRRIDFDLSPWFEDWPEPGLDETFDRTGWWDI